MADIYPKERRVRDKSHRKWRVEYRNMIYDGGGSSSWDDYYHTRIGAKIAAAFHWHLGSWGGDSIKLYPNYKESKRYDNH